MTAEAGAKITAGKFAGFEVSTEIGVNTLTITGDVDWSQGDGGLWEALYDIRAVAVEADASFDAGEHTISVAITNDGTITGGTIDGEIRAKHGVIKGCTFGPNATVTDNKGAHLCDHDRKRRGHDV